MTHVKIDGAAQVATPDILIERPADDYDPHWVLYNQQNPHTFKSVGADAPAEGGEGEGDGEGGGEGEGEGSGEQGKEGEAKEGEGEGQKAGEHFSDSYQDESVRAIAKRYNTEAEMAAALKDANTEISQRVKIPGDDASDEDKAKFAKAMGVPEAVTDYTITRPEHMPEEQFQSEEMQAGLTGVVTKMHAAGASQAVVDAAMDTYFEMEATQLAQQAKQDKEFAETTEAALRKEWDKNYDANKAAADAAFAKYPDLGQMELKDGSLAGSSIHFVKLMAEVGRLNGESAAHLGLQNSEAGKDLQAEHARLTGEINDATKAGDKVTAQRLDDQRREVSKKLYGTAPADGRSV